MTETENALVAHVANTIYRNAGLITWHEAALLAQAILDDLAKLAPEDLLSYAEASLVNWIERRQPVTAEDARRFAAPFLGDLWRRSFVAANEEATKFRLEIMRICPAPLPPGMDYAPETKVTWFNALMKVLYPVQAAASAAEKKEG